MPISIHKLLSILLVLGIVVQAFISCTLKFPEPELASSSSEEDSSSSQTEASSSSSAEGQDSSGSVLISSDSSMSSSSLDDDPSISSSSGNILPSSSSSRLSSSSSRYSSSSSLSSSSSRPSSSSSPPCTAKDNTQTHYCSDGTMKQYGSVTDNGGQIYKTVEINSQIWMAANLNYTPSSGKHRCYAQGNGNGGDTWLAPDKPTDQPKIKANCDKYGRLYDWETAMNLSNCNNKSCAVNEPHQGICPSGWHLPDTSEWNALRKFIEKDIFDNWEDVDFGWDVGTKLKAIDTTFWRETSTSDKGVDSYGFTAVGSGYCVSCEELSSATGYFSGEREEAHWWTATEYKNQWLPNDPVIQAYKTKVTFSKKVMNLEFEKKADYLFSVRCVKNK